MSCFRPYLFGVINLRRLRLWVWVALFVTLILLSISLARHLQPATGSHTEWNIVAYGIDPDPGQWEGKLPFAQTKLKDVRARADAILLIKVDISQDTVRVVQVPRDSLVLTELGWQKINWPLFAGGHKYAQEMLFRLVPHRFDKTVMVSYEGLQAIIDAMGGVTIEVMEELVTPKGSVWLSKGVHNLTGKEAFQFVRHRYKDPLGDLGRMQRQKQLLDAVRQKALSLSPSAYYEVLKVGVGAVKTDLSLRDIVILGEYFLTVRPQVKFMTLPGEARPPEWHYYPNQKAILEKVIPFINGTDS